MLHVFSSLLAVKCQMSNVKCQPPCLFSTTVNYLSINLVDLLSKGWCNEITYTVRIESVSQSGYFHTCSLLQAKEGPCNTSRPGFWDVVGRAKWSVIFFFTLIVFQLIIFTPLWHSRVVLRINFV